MPTEITYVGEDAVPVLHANHFTLSVNGLGEHVLTFGQSGSLSDPNGNVVRVVGRFALSAQRVAELGGVLRPQEGA